MSDPQRKRLPANGRGIRSEILAGRRPRIGGGCIAIATDWRIGCPIPTLVCPPEELPAEQWQLGFLAGTEILLLFRANHEAFARELADVLRCAGCVLVAPVAVPEAAHA